MDDNHTLDELAETYNRRLVDALKGQGALTSPLVENAFLSIPRHAFIDSYYVHDATSTETEQWRRIEHPAGGDIAAWLEGIYANVALVTAFDEAGSPSSSSSSPDIMAFMLEALRLGPGMRVLEIGTGTGYNAALLASIVGDLQLVFSVELEPSLAHAAQQRLDSVVGKEVQVKGSVQTWERLLHAYQEWVSLGQPKMADYVFEVDEEGEQVIRIQDNIWELSS